MSKKNKIVRKKKKKPVAGGAATAAAHSSSYGHRPKLAQQIVDEVSYQVTSSHSVIAATRLPFLLEDEIPSAYKRFGRPLIDRYLDYLDIAREIRGGIKALLPRCASGRLGADYLQKSMALCLATAEFGVGECGEMTFLAAHKLLKNGQGDLALITIIANPEKRNGNPYGHQFLVLGKNDGLKSGDISQLAHLAKGTLIIDPFLGYVGQANRYLEIQSEYIKCYGFHSIRSVRAFDERLLAKMTQIESDANFLKKQAEMIGLTAYDRDMALLKEGVRVDCEASSTDVIISEPDGFGHKSIPLAASKKHPQLLFSLDKKAPQVTVDVKSAASKALLVDNMSADYGRFFSERPGSVKEQLALSELKAGL